MTGWELADEQMGLKEEEEEMEKLLAHHVCASTVPLRRYVIVTVPNVSTLLLRYSVAMLRTGGFNTL